MPSSSETTLALLSSIQATRRSRLMASRIASQLRLTASAPARPAGADASGPDGDAAGDRGAAIGTISAGASCSGRGPAACGGAGLSARVPAPGAAMTSSPAERGGAGAGPAFPLSGGRVAGTASGVPAPGHPAGLWWCSAGRDRAGGTGDSAAPCWPGCGRPAEPVGPARPPPRSSRSSRARSAFSSVLAAGSRICAHISSSSSRGEVAPRIWSRALLTISAARVRLATPNRSACRLISSSRSGGTSSSPVWPASGTAASTIRSRKRSSMSAANRRGSWPPSMIRFTTRNTAALSAAANASVISSRSVASV